MQEAMTSETRVAPRPMLRVEWSLMAPMIWGENVSPKAWMQKRLMEIAVARTAPSTEFTMAALSGPVLRKMKNSAQKSAGMVVEWGPKKTRIPKGMVQTTLQNETR